MKEFFEYVKGFFEDVKYFLKEEPALMLGLLLSLLSVVVLLYLLVSNPQSSSNDLMWYVIGRNVYK